jgi:NADPH:quinone reductase-like Zn-dependent oxidoreductase
LKPSAEFAQVATERLAELSRFVEKGAVKVYVDKTFPLSALRQH